MDPQSPPAPQTPGGASPRGGRILALDLGERRIGLALSDEAGDFAFPAGVIDRRKVKDELAQIASLVRERGVVRIVLGLPIHMSGRAGPEAEAARRFGAAVAAATGLGVDLLDERWTSKEAERALRGSRTRRRRGKGVVDETAAAILLRAYLERRRIGPPPDASPGDP